MSHWKTLIAAINFGLSEETPGKWKHTNKQLQTPSKAKNKIYLLSRFKLICLEWIGKLNVIWKIFGGFWTKLSCNMKVKSSERGAFQMLCVEVKLYPKLYFVYPYISISSKYSLSFPVHLTWPLSNGYIIYMVRTILKRSWILLKSSWKVLEFALGPQLKSI